MKSKRSMEKLLKSVEEHFSEDEEKEETFSFLISSNELSLPSRPVHLPGYPE